MPRYYVSICAQYKAESKWLREWCVYHLLVGCEHIYLLSHDDPGSADDLAARQQLKPFVDQGILSLEYNASRTSNWQMSGWSQIMRNWGATTHWMVFTDLDCFLFPVPDGVMSIVPLLRERDTPDCAGLEIFEIPFGDSGLLQSPSLQTESFVRREAVGTTAKGMVAYIMRPDRLEPGKGYGKVRDGYIVKDTSGRSRQGLKASRDGLPVDVLRFNHYAIRSKEDWQAKSRRGWLGVEEEGEWKRGGRAALLAHKYKQLNKNDVLDTSMWRFVPELRRRLEALRCHR